MYRWNNNNEYQRNRRDIDRNPYETRYRNRREQNVSENINVRIQGSKNLQSITSDEPPEQNFQVSI